MSVSFPFASLLLTLAWATSALALEPPRQDETEAMQFHGFIGQRLTYTDHNHFFGQTAAHASLEYTEAGLNASWQLTPSWLASAQVIARHAGQSETGSPALDYGFVQWTPLDDAHLRLSAKLGRFKIPYGLFNEGRDTPMTRDGIIPAQSIYFDGLRAFNQSSSGALLAMEHTLGEGVLTLEAGLSKVNTRDENARWVLPPYELQGRFDSQNARLARLLYEEGRIRLAFSTATGEIGYTPATGEHWGIATPLSAQINFSYDVLSTQYNSDHWSLTWEYNRSHVESRATASIPLLGTQTQSQPKDGFHWYAEGIWHLTPRWDGMLRYDRACNDDKAPSDWTQNARDWSIGLRYRPTPEWLLAGEFHRVDGVAWVPAADNIVNGSFMPENLSRRWNLLMFQVSYQF